MCGCGLVNPEASSDPPTRHPLSRVSGLGSEPERIRAENGKARQNRAQFRGRARGDRVVSGLRGKVRRVYDDCGVIIKSINIRTTGMKLTTISYIVSHKPRTDAHSTLHVLG